MTLGQLLYTTPTLDFPLFSSMIEKEIEKTSPENIQNLFDIFNTLTQSKPSQNQNPCESTHILDYTLSSTQRAHYHYLRAIIYSLANNSLLSIKNLEECVKLDSNHYKAWLKIAEYYEKFDTTEAFDVTVHSYNKTNDPKITLKLAQFLRVHGILVEHIEQGLVLCKHVLKQDISSAQAWYGVGVSLIKLYNFKHDHDLLFKATAALSKSFCEAGINEAGINEADIYLNRASAYFLLGMYQSALMDYSKAAIDKVLYPEARQQIEYIKTFSIAVNEALNVFVSLKAGNSCSSRSIKTSESFKILGIVSSGLPRIFLAIDKAKNIFGLTIYNIADDCIKRNDFVDVVEAVTEDVQIEFEECKVQYANVKVLNPNIILVNGTKVSKDYILFGLAEFRSISDEDMT